MAVVLEEEAVTRQAAIATEDQVPSAGPRKTSLEIAAEILEGEWPTIDKRTAEVLAGQSVAQPFMQEDTFEEISERLTKLVTAQLPNLRKRRKSKGGFYQITWSAAGNKSGEIDPESTVAAEQALTQVALNSSASDSNEYIQRGHERAADEMDHILCGVSPRTRMVLQRDLEQDSQDYAASEEFGRTERQRAREEARRASEFQIFKQRPKARRIACKPYNPRGVSMDNYNRTPGEPCLAYIGVDKRTSVGTDIVCTKDILCTTNRGSAEADEVRREQPAPVTNPYSPSNGCAHENRKLKAASYGYVDVVCSDCNTTLKERRYAFARAA
jgi:hypothetical protein